MECAEHHANRASRQFTASNLSSHGWYDGPAGFGASTIFLGVSSWGCNLWGWPVTRLGSATNASTGRPPLVVVGNDTRSQGLLVSASATFPTAQRRCNVQQ